jgi:hypothetical protein
MIATVRIPHVEDDWRVFAVSDIHGVVSGFLAALREAGIVDAKGHWSAPPRTALVGCGDYVDRGTDVVGLLRLLRRLEEESAAAGGRALFARGNHEEMAVRGAAAEPAWLDLWRRYGGVETLRSYDCGPDCDADPAQIARAMEAADPGVLGWLAGLPEAVRWRDVLLVHGGLVPGYATADLGEATGDHLWIRAGFYAADRDNGSFDAYTADGIERVVFGHTPQDGGPTLFHDGRSICIDTNAVGNPHVPAAMTRMLTLLELRQGPAFDTQDAIIVPTADAPERFRDATDP